jgi:hypothetical protein
VPIGTPVAMSRGVQALIASPIAVLLFSGARLLIVSNYNTNSALALAAAGGVVGTILGTILPLLPPYLPAIAIIFAIFRKVGLTLLAVVSAILITPAYAAARTAIMHTMVQAMDLAAVIRRLQDQAHSPSELFNALGELFRIAPFVIVVVALGMLVSFAGSSQADGFLGFLIRFISGLFFAGIGAFMVLFVQNAYRVPAPDYAHISQALRRPWVPSEVVTFKTTTPRVGYVISVKDRWFVIMNEGDRSVESFHDDEVVRRRGGKLGDDTFPFPLLAADGSTPNSEPICPLVTPPSDAA